MIMSREFNFEFSDLPLVIENGIQAGIVEGIAVISYGVDCNWVIKSIYLYGYQRNDPSDRASYPVMLVTGTMLEMIIRHRLKRDWFGHVQDAVNVDIDEN